MKTMKLLERWKLRWIQITKLKKIEEEIDRMPLLEPRREYAEITIQVTAKEPEQ